ncbi:uncharacterized protein LOC113217522 [Frankliniella occidentalis]|uniref:Uncharacterized protein LOC113217522 n=1 Tax=Frankliniella occidentalis TaxID=133901 RepID=A0A6J1TKG9_FRAOC|nr:uncharacterized protein LOC113217522 [Frankliniella occidentalis]
METPVRKVVILQHGSGKRFIKMHPDQMRSVVSLPQSQSFYQPNFSQPLQLSQPSQSSPSSSHQPQPSQSPKMSFDSAHQVFAISPAGADSTHKFTTHSTDPNNLSYQPQSSLRRQTRKLMRSVI